MRSDVNFSTYMAVLTYSMLTLWIHDKGMLTLECYLPHEHAYFLFFEKEL